MAKAKDSGEVFVMKVEQGALDVCIKGASPLIINRMSEKAKRELLLPRGKKNAAEKASNAKHDPLTEYRASAYTLKSGPTLLALLATAFKGALRTAALDMPGASKTQIGRLTYVTGDYIGIYGVPQLFMSVTRSADQKKTPDIRTRCIVPQWACQITVNYVMPILREQAVVNLLAAAGMYIGVGDWRPEKGSGNFGQFSIVSPDDEEFQQIIKGGGRDAQSKALEDPSFYDDDTADLYNWAQTEMRRRGFKVAA